ncbi:MAG: NUDIX hydrolase [Gemmatimonadaceae bacterium]|nr:NUDIX hydrolase [Gemmatimonadaceae bacterium]
MGSKDSVPPRLSSRRAYSGRVISLDVDTVRFPDGSVGELEMVRHPGASAVVPFLDDPASSDPRILLIHQYRYAADAYLLEIPAGRLEDGESPEFCAARELEEETGRKARKLEKLVAFYTTPGFTDERIHLFMAWELESGRVARERDEFIEERSIHLSEAIRLIDSGEISDAKTAVGIMIASRRRLRS